jgi:hypothetical protein
MQLEKTLKNMTMRGVLQNFGPKVDDDLATLFFCVHTRAARAACRSLPLYCSPAILPFALPCASISIVA